MEPKYWRRPDCPRSCPYDSDHDAGIGPARLELLRLSLRKSFICWRSTCGQPATPAFRTTLAVGVMAQAASARIGSFAGRRRRAFRMVAGIPVGRPAVADLARVVRECCREDVSRCVGRGAGALAAGAAPAGGAGAMACPRRLIGRECDGRREQECDGYNNGEIRFIKSPYDASV
jgi:hypothetical protein